MSTVEVSVGLPGSGKSTEMIKRKEFWWRLFHFRAFWRRCVYICPDDIRVEWGDVNDQSRNSEVWNEAYRRLEVALKAGYDVVFDATNTALPLRQKLVTFCHEHGARVHGVWLDTPLTTCLARNARRERQVPVDVIQRMHAQLELNPPQRSEFYKFEVITP